MMQSHDHLESLAEGYVLLALDPEDLRAFEARLATCDLCAQRVALARSVVDGAPPCGGAPCPTPGLRDRALDAARQLPTVRPAPRPAGRLRRLFPLRAVAAAALALLATPSEACRTWCGEELRPDFGAVVKLLEAKAPPKPPTTVRLECRRCGTKATVSAKQAAEGFVPLCAYTHEAKAMAPVS